MLTEAQNEQGLKLVIKKTDHIIEQNERILEGVNQSRTENERNRAEVQKSFEYSTELLKAMFDDYERNREAQEEEATKRREEEAILRELRLEENAKARETRQEENAKAREMELLGIDPHCSDMIHLY